MPFGFPDTFEIKPTQNWGNPAPTLAPQIPNQDDAKRLYGIELAKDHRNAFEAACVVFPNDTRQALWASQNWLTDPVVIASKEVYLKTVDLVSPILDKEQLAAKVLALAEEKNAEGTRYLIDAKERIAALHLYAKIAGYTDKVDINASTNNFTNNSMTIKFVKPETKEKEDLIDVTPTNTDTLVDNPLDIKIKLVGTG